MGVVVLWPSCASALLVLVACATSQVAESRLILLINLELQAFKLHRQAAATVDLPTQIVSYYKGSGFPKAERSLQQKIDEVDAFLAAQPPKTGAIGVSTAIVYKDHVAYAKGYGLRRYNESETAVTSEDLFQIGSVTKTITALGVGLLVEEGKLHWNNPVMKHMPWLKLFDKYAEEHLRIGDLLSMNSSLGRSQDPPLYFCKYDSARSLIEGLQFSEPESSLRENYAYANFNYVILGRLIEEASGKPLSVFLKERIWTPLGMNHTFPAVEDVPVVVPERWALRLRQQRRISVRHRETSVGENEQSIHKLCRFEELEREEAVVGASDGSERQPRDVEGGLKRARPRVE